MDNIHEKGDRKFKCELCDYCAREKGNLVRHAKTVHDTKREKAKVRLKRTYIYEQNQAAGSTPNSSDSNKGFDKSLAQNFAQLNHQPVVLLPKILLKLM